MRKKFFNVFLLGALLATPAVTFVSCSDYDDDIDSLQGQIDQLSNSYKSLETKINQGILITSVDNVTNGIQLTFSDGTTQTLTNGTDGEDGKDADIWTIDSNGYWTKNNVPTSYKAIGEDGTNGAPGQDGTNGSNGKDGAYYVPDATTGTFIKHNADGTTEDTGISYVAPGTLTAVINADGDLEVSNVSDGNGSTTTWKFASAVASLQESLEAVQALFRQVQSVAFLPTYKDASGAIVPVYHYVSGYGDTLDFVNHLKYIVKPSELAARLVSKSVKEHISLVGGDRLKTRAYGDGQKLYGQVLDVQVLDAKNGIIDVTAQFYGLDFPAENKKYSYPFALVLEADSLAADADGNVEADPTTRVSSDAFLAVTRQLRTYEKKLAPLSNYLSLDDDEKWFDIIGDGTPYGPVEGETEVDMIHVYYDHFTKHNVTEDLKSVLKAADTDEDSDELDYKQDLKITHVLIINNQDTAWVPLATANSASKTSTTPGYAWKTYFTVSADGVAVNPTPNSNPKTANYEAINKEVTVRLVDDRFRTKANGSLRGDYESWYRITYKAVEHALTITFNTFLEAYTWDAQYFTEGRTKEIWLTKDSINTAQSILDKFHYTKEKAYNELLKKVQNEGPQTWTVSTGYPNVQYEVTLEVKQNAAGKDQLVATIVYKKTANYNYSPVEMSKRISVLAKDVDSSLSDALLFYADFNAIVTYSYGDHRFYEEFSSRWDNGKFSVKLNWEAVNDAYKAGSLYYYKEISLTEAYENYYKYSAAPYNLKYQFELQNYPTVAPNSALDKTTIYLDKSDDSTPSLSVAATNKNEAYINLKSIVTTGGTVVPYDSVRVRVSVIEQNGYVINDPNTTENRRDLKNQPYTFNIVVTLPLDNSDIKIESNDSTYNTNLGIIAANTPYDVIKYVQINSTKCLTAKEPQTEGVVFVQDGKLIQDDIVVGGITQEKGKVLGWDPELSYEIIKAVNADGQVINGDNQYIFNATDGTITIPDPHNVLNDWTFTIRVTLKYTFGSIYKDYQVVIPRQPR